MGLNPVWALDPKLCSITDVHNIIIISFNICNIIISNTKGVTPPKRRKLDSWPSNLG